MAFTEAADDSDHVPMIVDNNTQIPSRIKALIEKTGDDPGPVLSDMAKRLESSGAEALAMPCNTAHFYAPIIEQSVNIPLLNMVTLAASQLKALSPIVKRVGLLASPAVLETHVFDQIFESSNMDIIYPANQHQMLDAIRAVKINSGDRSARQTMRNAAQELTDRGADCLLIACSELSIIADTVPLGIPCLDTIDILAQAIIEFSGGQLRNDELHNHDSVEALEVKRA